MPRLLRLESTHELCKRITFLASNRSNNEGGLGNPCLSQHQRQSACSLIHPHRSASRRRLRAEGTESAVDLEAQLEKFMQKQAEIESGAAFVRARDPNAVIGADVVPDEVRCNFDHLPPSFIFASLLGSRRQVILPAACHQYMLCHHSVRTSRFE